MERRDIKAAGRRIGAPVGGGVATVVTLGQGFRASLGLIALGVAFGAIVGAMVDEVVCL